MKIILTLIALLICTTTVVQAQTEAEENANIEQQIQMLILENCTKYGQIVVQFKIMLKMGMSPNEIMEQRVHPYVEAGPSRAVFVNAIEIAAKHLGASDDFTKDTVVSECVRKSGKLER